MSTPSDRIGFKVAILFGLGVMAAMTVSEAVTELSSIAREFHPSNPSLIGLVMSMPSMVVALGALMAGYLVDRIGDRPILLAGAVMAILGDICVISAPTLHLLLAARLLDGVGYVLTIVASITMLMRITDGKQRTTALALWSTSVPVSFILPFLTAGIAVALGTWRAAFAIHAGVTALLLVIAISSLPGPEKGPGRYSRTAGLSVVLKSPWPYLLGLSFAANAFLLSGSTATLGPYLAHRYGISELSVQYWNIVAMLVNVASSLLVGRWLNRGVPAFLIGIGGIALTIVPACMIFGLPLGYAVSIGAFWLFTFGSGLLVGMWALVPGCAPTQKSLGATSGLVTQLTLIGVLLGAPMAFAAQSAATPAPMLTLVIGATVICFLGGAPVWRRASSSRAVGVPGGSAAIGIR